MLLLVAELVGCSFFEIVVALRGVVVVVAAVGEVPAADEVGSCRLTIM